MVSLNKQSEITRKHHVQPLFTGSCSFQTVSDNKFRAPSCVYKIISIGRRYIGLHEPNPWLNLMFELRLCFIDTQCVYSLYLWTDP